MTDGVKVHLDPPIAVAGTSPERARHLEQLYVLATSYQGKGPMSRAYEALLAYFNEYEPAVAAAIRYGFGDSADLVDVLINYPDDHPNK